MTIDGSNFRSSATVTFVDSGGAKAATSVSVVSGDAHHGGHSGPQSGVEERPRAELRSDLRYAPERVHLPGSDRQVLRPAPLPPDRHATGDRSARGPALASGDSGSFALAGTCGVPPGARALSVNLTVTGAAAPGYLTLYPAYGSAPLASNVNFSAGETRANNAVLAVSQAGNAASPS